MNYNIEQLLDIILSKSELTEERIKEESELKELTIKQLHCIELIHQMTHPTLTELAEKLETTKPSASVLIDRLADRGYIRKVKSDSDRRSAHVHLTEKGEKAAHLHIQVHAEFAKLLTQNLTPSEISILEVLLSKAILNL